MRATEIDRAIKNFDDSLVMWQRLALAEIYRETVHRVGDSYTLDEFLNESDYGTLAERAECEFRENHGLELCAPMACLVCGAHR